MLILLIRIIVLLQICLLLLLHFHQYLKFLHYSFDFFSVKTTAFFIAVLNNSPLTYENKIIHIIHTIWGLDKIIFKKKTVLLWNITMIKIVNIIYIYLIKQYTTTFSFFITNNIKLFLILTRWLSLFKSNKQ